MGTIWYELRNENQDAYVYDIVIWPQHRRRGFARRAFLMLERQMHDIGIRRIVLNVFEQNLCRTSPVVRPFARLRAA